MENVGGVILSGSPFSVHDAEAPQIELELFDNLPILGVCYGAQQIANQMGGEVKASNTREYGRARLSYVQDANPLMKGVTVDSQVWMSHGDSIASVAEEFEIIASTPDVKVAGYQVKDRALFGIQFHPEVYHSEQGKIMLGNFLLDVCQMEANWTPDWRVCYCTRPSVIISPVFL